MSEHFLHLQQLRADYLAGENIVSKLRRTEDKTINGLNDILISYDLQAGSYVRAAEDNLVALQQRVRNMAAIINPLLQTTEVHSCLDVGTGEATTLVHLLRTWIYQPKHIYAFDISLSRLIYAQSYLNQYGFKPHLFTGSIANPPLMPNSVDLVMSVHALEPNGGNEQRMLMALHKVARKYLVLFEPGYEFAFPEAQSRMRAHGYVTCLGQTARDLGYEVVRHELLPPPYANPLNPTAVLVIKKDAALPPASSVLACPLTRTPLELHHGSYFSPQALLAYPVLREIPCLLPENAIVATHFLCKNAS